MSPATSIDIPEAGQEYGVGPGLYAVVESFPKLVEWNQEMIEG